MFWALIGLGATGEQAPEEKRRTCALSGACLGRRIRGPNLGSEWVAADSSVHLRQAAGMGHGCPPVGHKGKPEVLLRWAAGDALSYKQFYILIVAGNISFAP
jgi:hypothetical protein